MGNDYTGPKFRTGVVWIIGILLIIAVGWLWSPWEIETETAGNRAKATDPGAPPERSQKEERVPRMQAGAEKENSIAETPTAEEAELVRERLATAHRLLHEIEAKAVNPVMVRDTESRRIDHVHVPALNREQLDPVYTELTKAGREFPPGTAAARMFRREADEFLKSLGNLPAKHAMRQLNKATGEVTYGVTLLSEESTVTKGDDGAVNIIGKAISNQHADAAEVSHLFTDENPEE